LPGNFEAKTKEVKPGNGTTQREKKERQKQGTEFRRKRLIQILFIGGVAQK